MRKFILCTLILLGLVTALAGQETKAPQPYGASQFKWNYPGGSAVYNSAFSLLSPQFETFNEENAFVWTMADLGLGGTYYANSRIDFYTGIFDFSLGYTFTLPYDYNFNRTEHLGTFGITVNSDKLIIDNRASFGLGFQLYLQSNKQLAQLLTVNDSLSINYLIFNIPNIFRMDIASHFRYDYALDYQESLYQIAVNSVLTQTHGIGEIALEPIIAYAGGIGSNTKLKTQRNFLNFTTIGMLNGDVPFFTFGAGGLAEYRLYFLKALKGYQWYEDIYVSATAAYAYLSEDPTQQNSFYNKFYYGGGLGFKLFGAAPLSIQIIFDEKSAIGLTFMSGLINLN